MILGGCGAELNAAGGAPAALPAGAGRCAARAEPPPAARGRCVPGDGTVRPVAVPLRFCCPASPRCDPARYRALFAQPGPALGAESRCEKSSCDLSRCRAGESCSPRCCRSPPGTAACCNPSSELPAVLCVCRCSVLLSPCTCRATGTAGLAGGNAARSRTES